MQETLQRDWRKQQGPPGVHGTRPPPPQGLQRGMEIPVGVIVCYVCARERTGQGNACVLTVRGRARIRAGYGVTPMGVS